MNESLSTGCYLAQFLFFKGWMMNILWIAHRNLQHDLDKSTWIEMAKSMANRNHDITLVVLSTSGKKSYQELPGLNILELAVINRFPLVSISFHFQVLIFCLVWLFTLRPGIIMTHPYTALFILPTVFVAKLLKLKTKFILDIRTLPISSKSRADRLKNTLNFLSVWCAKFFFNGITVITPLLKQITSERFHVKLNRIGIWMSGVDTNHFQLKNQKSDSDHKSEKPFIVMYHGVLAENRGLIETVQAMAYVNKQFRCIKLVFLGKGLGKTKLIELASKLKLTKCIQFHDSVSYHKVPEFTSQADVGIIPLPDVLCWRISSPLKLFEYLAMEKPVIVSSIAAHTSVLRNCPAAIFVNTTSPPDIAAGIIKAYTMRNQLPRLGIEGRKFVTQNMTWDHQAKQLEEFLLNLR